MLETICMQIWAASWQNQPNGLCAQRRLRSAWASAQSDQSSLSAWRKLGSLTTHWMHREYSDQTGWMPRLIWVFAGRTGHFVGFVMRWLICRTIMLWFTVSWFCSCTRLTCSFRVPDTLQRNNHHLHMLYKRRWQCHHKSSMVQSNLTHVGMDPSLEFR